ncbi:hypothetical protein L6452_33524 [Arctium lappa]|uniref:Uncharacterized protein n=1 Tax=Arctium lappa TaxID=4217 RepID=A0ACB8YFK7_ARCLA|nr:hypothetical protein L6452_33524 [Arctium lappa]
MAVGILAIHLLALFAPFTFTWPSLWAAFWSYVLFEICGITLGYHRILAHHNITTDTLNLRKIHTLPPSGFGLVIWDGSSIVATLLKRWVALISFGEGWHNNHHAFEYSARHGLEWWQIDLGWYMIRFLEAVGLATNIKVCQLMSRNLRNCLLPITSSSDILLSQIFPRDFDLERNSRVNVVERIGTEGYNWIWRRELRGGRESNEVEQMLTIMDSVDIIESEDIWWWSLNPDGVFLV